MPIRVHCPNGCLLRMPADRAGKMVRCPGCKATISLPLITESEMRSGKPIPFQATLVQTFGKHTETNGQSAPEVEHAESATLMHDSLTTRESSRMQNADEIKEGDDASILTSIEEKVDILSNPVLLRSEVNPVLGLITNPSGSTLSTPALEPKGQTLPQILSPSQVRQIAAAAQEQRQKLVDDFEPISILGNSSDSLERVRESNPKSDLVIQDREFDSSGSESPSSSNAWRQRLQEANSNRKTLTKGLATLVFVVGFINAAPAIYHWYQSWSAVSSAAMPRWIYLQIFVSALHIVYSIFVFQVSDWSALRAVSVAMLVVAFGFGIVSTALLIEGGQGAITQFFSLSHLMVPKATIWSVSMLCLATLVAFVSGKEANDWKRAEQLLVEILNKST